MVSNAVVFFAGGYYKFWGRCWTEDGTRTTSGIDVAPKMPSSSSSLVVVSTRSGIVVGAKMVASSSSSLVVSTRSGIVVGGMVAASSASTSC